MQPVFIISDGSGLTAETISHTLLSQFPKVSFEHVSLPFVDDLEKLQVAIGQINDAGRNSGHRPLVFTTFVRDEFSELLDKAEAEIFNLFEPFISKIETLLEQPASYQLVGSVKDYQGYDA